MPIDEVVNSRGEKIRRYRAPFEDAPEENQSHADAKKAGLSAYAYDFSNVMFKEFEKHRGTMQSSPVPIRHNSPVSVIPSEITKKVIGECAVINGNSYANAVHKLRRLYDLGKCPNQPKIKIAALNLVRPLTFKETLQARVEDFNRLKDSNGAIRTEEDRLRLFKTYLDSCTGNAYKAGTTKFKIIPVCRELITIDSAFNGKYLPVDYDNLNYQEFDSKNGNYFRYMGKKDILEHEAWLAAVEDDKSLLGEHYDIVSKVLSDNEIMAFGVRNNTQENELKALCAYALVNLCDAVGYSDLGYIAHFLRVTQ